MNRYTSLTQKYLLGQKKRSILTIVGIILSVTLLTAIGTIGLSFRDKVVRQTVQEYGDYHVSFNGLPGEAISKVVNNASVESAGIISREGYSVISKTSEKEKRENPFAAPYRYLNLKNYNIDAMSKLQIQLDAGRLPKNSHEIILPTLSLDSFPTKPKLGDSIKLNLGDRIVASTGEMKKINGLGDRGWDQDEDFRPQTEREFTVVGFSNPGTKGSWSANFILPAITYDDNQTIKPDKKYFIYVKMKSMDQIEPKTKAIISSLNVEKVDQGSAVKLDRDIDIKNVRIDYNNELLKLYGKSTYEGVNHSLLYAFAAIIIIIMGCTSAVIYNTFHISVLERTSQFGMLRCIGATPSQIRKLVLKEATILSLIGIPVGLFTGTVFMKLLFYNISFLALGFLNDMQMVISLPILIIAGVLGLLTVYLSAIGPARLAAKVSPLEAINGSGSTKVDNVMSIRKSMLVKKLFGMEGQFASRNIRRNKKRFRITAFSMVVSMLLFIVFSGLAGFLGQTSQSGIEYSYSVQYEGDSKRIDDSVYSDIVKIDAVEHAYKLYSHQVMAILPKDKVNPKYYELRKGMYSVEEGEGYRTDNNFLESYGDNGLDALKSKLTAGTIDKDKMNQENGVILNQKIRIITTEEGKQIIIDQTQFKVGDHIQVRTLEGGNQKYKTLTVTGIVEQGVLSKDYNESAMLELITTPEVIEKVTGNDAYSRIFILAKTDISNKPITDYLKSLTEKDAGYSYMDNVMAQAKAKNDATTASIFLYGFIGVIVLIAFLNILNTVSTNLILRTKEFAVLKAIGMTQRNVGKMILLEGVLYGLYAAVYGSILGTILSYGIHHLFKGAVDVGWAIPWSSIVLACAGAIATTLVATAWPMYRLNQTIIVEALRKET
ncbi:FtsX-like permease family protein [Paenibacillus sp. 2003]|uniref:FtsX-like permease family protein n=1 Tax=Paenibacillus TaxID=44249 RepID=UPI002855831B|nr:FtsX-like permease family protein [Paenibacillus sp. 2003]MDR6717002.1 putative ABC transport system permease protein [Paenibacillus sp. 2003]